MIFLKIVILVIVFFGKIVIFSQNWQFLSYIKFWNFWEINLVIGNFARHEILDFLSKLAIFVKMEIFNSRNFTISKLTVTIRAGNFLPKWSKIDFWGTKHPWILKIPPKIPPKIKFCIFWCYKRKPEMKFSKFRTPEVDRKFIFRLVWLIFVWHEESS